MRNDGPSFVSQYARRFGIETICADDREAEFPSKQIHRSCVFCSPCVMQHILSPLFQVFPPL